jgi:translation initiation factor 3 subunit A
MSEKKKILISMGENVDAMTEAELLAIDADKLAKEHAEKSAKKKDNAERKLNEIRKKLDYTVRAIRIEEAPLIKKRQEEKCRVEKESYEADIIKRAQEAKLQWEEDCKAKEALMEFGVFGCMASFEKAVMKGRVIQHKVLCAEEDKRAELIAEKAKLQRARKRKEEELRRKKEEEERLRKEVEKKKLEEERLKRDEERRKKEAEMEELRRKKEAERQSFSRSNELPSADTKGPTSQALDSASSNKYVPPAKRGASGSKGYGTGGGARNAWSSSSRGGSFGGGIYDGRGGGGRANS